MRQTRTILFAAVLMCAFIALCAWFAHSQTPVIGPSQSASIIGTVTPTLYSNTATIGFTNFARANTAGFYRVCGYLLATVAATAGTAQLYAGFTADGHGVTPNFAAPVSVTTQWAQQNACTVFYADAATNIQYSIQLVGVTGTPTFRYTFSAEKLF
jgi:hypothetical protein